MRYTFYTNSADAWGGMLETIAGAKKSIYLEMYIFSDDTPGHDFFGTLKQKAKEGVSVKVIIDSVGSAGLQSQAVKDLEASGVEALFFSYWLRRTHKKILVVDEKIAFVGGVNIHKLFRKWNDLHIRLQGPIVRSIIRSFARSYALCGGADARILAWQDTKTVFGKTKLWIFEQWQLSGKRPIKKYYQESIRNAREDITIVTPYLVPHQWFIGALHQALLRGVAVRILLPEYTDHWVMDRVNYFYMYRLNKLGAVFYLYKGMNHAKAMLIDNKEGLIGSHNIDPLSFQYNSEAGVFFREENMVRDLKAIIEVWKKESVIFNPSAQKPKWIDYAVAPFIRIFQSIF